MIRIRRVALATALTVFSALSTTAEAQGPRGPGPGAGPGGGAGRGGAAAAVQAGMPALGMGGGQGSNPVSIMLAPSVQKELKLTDEQKTKVYSFALAANQKGRGTMGRSMGFGAGNNDMQALMKLRQESDKGLAQILDATQKERLDQIALQAEGPLAVARPEIAAKLNLNNTQNQYVQGIMMQIRQEMVMAIQQEMANGRQVNPEEVRGLATQLRRGAVQEVSKVINSKQKAAFDKLLGPPFDLKTLESETANANPEAADGANNPADNGQAKEDPGDGPNPEAGAAKAKPGSPAARKKGRTKAGGNP